MTINIFEGARRVRILIAGLVTVGTVALVIVEAPSVSATFLVDGPGTQPKRAVADYECSDGSASESQIERTEKGIEVFATLCFSPRRVTHDNVVDLSTVVWDDKNPGQQVAGHVQPRWMSAPVVDEPKLNQRGSREEFEFRYRLEQEQAPKKYIDDPELLAQLNGATSPSAPVVGEAEVNQSNPREELIALRRRAQLEDKAAGGEANPFDRFDKKGPWEKYATAEWLIPIRPGPKPGQWWGGKKDTPEVFQYTGRVAKSFRLSAQDEAWVNDQYRRERFNQFVEAGGWIVAGLLGFWVASFLIGWIVRGFLGIPSGFDRKPTE